MSQSPISRGTPSRKVIPYSALAIAWLSSIVTFPAVIAAAPALVFNGSPILTVVGLALAPALYAVSYGLLAGVLSRPFRWSIVPGRFERNLDDSLYRARRLHGLCWTAVYYAKPIYFLFLSVPFLKASLFRLFGYSGSMAFTTYPDTWIRDLPMLKLGRDAYLSNRATLGTNTVFPNGSIRVDTITLDDEALVGHLSMIGGGTRLGKRAEVGVGCAIGMKNRLEDGVRVGPQTTIEHFVVIGREASIGNGSFIGSGVRIAPGLVLPPASYVPARTLLRTQEDVENLDRGSRLVSKGARSVA